MAVSAAELPKWQASKSCAAKIIFSTNFFLLTSRYCRIESKHHPNGEMIMNHYPRMMSILEDTNLINALLNELADREILEPMVEPIDDLDCSPFDYAEVTGLWEEMYPEPENMVDENGKVWYFI